MGSYTFRWPHAADEVFVTGTFDDWGKTVRLDRKGDVFEKEVQLPTTDEKIQYKFVVDGTWTTDPSVPEEDDGHNNINNVLYPEHIHKETQPTLQNGTAAIMAGVTPDSTTAAMAAGVPKTSSKDGVLGDAAFSSTAPGSTTAELAKNAPLEQRATMPGAYSGDAEQTFSVNPIPASSGMGNPIKLQPGEKVPDSSTFNSNTVESTARTDPSAYEQSASYPTSSEQIKPANAFAVPPVSGNMIPESSLPMGGASQGTAEPYTIQSAAPTSTTAALAANVPLESQKRQANGGQNAPADDVPDVVRRSISEAHRDPEAAANREVVEEKREMEEELQHKVPREESAGTPAPTASAALAETAPQPTGVDSSQISPRATTPTDGPTVTTGVEAAKAPQESVPPVETTGAAGETGASATKTTGAAAQPASKTGNAGAQNGVKEEKKKKKGFFSRLKEKLK
ncbi:N-terminal Early set domain protein [Aspergillus terreus]|uniref:N-terminal Early set domain protein n=1 Tax=Aspergillus terreus TaxID=33178 RepID=A0A5M3YTX4_ASPTE|nr:hypothetical protein ATETN484_0002051700 [Aspergillus terreus]GFF15373.1 N-terminal Early set domain protein [Aspergillus terreus]